MCLYIALTKRRQQIYSKQPITLAISSLSVNAVVQHGKWGLNSKSDEQDSLCPLANSLVKYELAPRGHHH